MKKTLVIEATEEEIVSIIRDNFHQDYDSIVALEELGNEVAVYEVTPDIALGIQDMHGQENPSLKYKLNEILNALAEMGAIEPGQYLIDCRW